MAHANPSQKPVDLFSQHHVAFQPCLGCTVRDAPTSSDGNHDTLQDQVPTTQWVFVFFRTFRTQVLDLLSAHPGMRSCRVPPGFYMPFLRYALGHHPLAILSLPPYRTAPVHECSPSGNRAGLPLGEPVLDYILHSIPTAVQYNRRTAPQGQ